MRRCRANHDGHQNQGSESSQPWNEQQDRAHQFTQADRKVEVIGVTPRFEASHPNRCAGQLYDPLQREQQRQQNLYHPNGDPFRRYHRTSGETTRTTVPDVSESGGLAITESVALMPDTTSTSVP